MHPLLQALLSPWEWRLEIVVVLLILVVLYGLGWSRLRRHSTRQRLATWPRLVAYYAGLAVLAVSLMSPIDRLGGHLFFMHMVQHMLTVMVAVDHGGEGPGAAGQETSPGAPAVQHMHLLEPDG